ncbi:MAG: hypothetical protein ACKOWF_15025 [Chloroflexota bacterium]
MLRAAIVAVAAVFMVGANAAFATRQVPVSTGQASGPIMPATYAFAIWGVIFALVIGFGVYALLPGNPGRDLVRATGYPAALSFITAGVWPILVAFRQLDLAQVVIVLMWAALAATYLRVIPVEGMTGAERWLGGLTFGLFFGWVTAANAVSIQSRIAAWGAGSAAVDAVGVVAILAAGLIAGWFVRRGQAGPEQLWLSYAAAVGWAIVAIVARQAGSSALGVAAALIAAIPAVLAVVAGLRQHSPVMPAGRSA